ncbi:MAG TPA: MFS transporter [Microbacterium sp.]|uniref:MFS transporter n=1 Tax=Microbacterium sp. TaxID=51671 RepID=UPI002CA34F0B|nr:MFS transporter [Microbacterium sp.]HWI29884.1 MFS transporter [Microbacterium sp.]
MSAAAPTSRARRSRTVVTGAYAAQGLGYAVVVTSLPVFKERFGVDDTVVALIVLLSCAAAAAGSVVADLLAKWRGSRIALSAGLMLEVAGLLLFGTETPFAVFIGGFVAYSIGLGVVDASGAMQGVLTQRRYGRDIMGGYFAAATGAAIVGALAVAGGSALALPPWTAILLAAAVAGVVGVLGLRRFDRTRAATPIGSASKVPLPRASIWLFGFVILAAFTLDSGVSTWSTVYLHDDLLAAAAIAPLGYAAYQGAVLVTRLVTDRATLRWTRLRVVVVATSVSIIGCIVVAFVPFVWAAIVGFALAGVGVGALVPLAFTSAGALMPARGDEVIARVNLFNYAGAVVGAVLIGLLADGPGLGLAFLLPAAALVGVLFVARRFRAPVPSAEVETAVPR